MGAFSSFLLAGSIGASLAGPIIGALSSGDERENAAKAMQEAMQQIKAVGAPPDLSKRLIIEKLQSAGVWKPEMEKAIDAGISKVAEIKESPEFAQKQRAALANLEQISKTGLTATGRAELNKLRMQTARDAEARSQSLRQQMQARGLGGGGAELAAQLSSGQAADIAAAEGADRLSTQQEAAKMQALGQMGAMAGQVRGQEFDIARAKAEAADKFKMFDISSQRDIEARRAAQETAARQYAIQNQQRISDINAQMANAETQRQAQAQRDYWSDRMSQARALAGVSSDEAKLYQQQGQAQQQGWTAAGLGVGQAAGAGAGYLLKYGKGAAGGGGGGKSDTDAWESALESAKKSPSSQYFQSDYSGFNYPGY